MLRVGCKQRICSLPDRWRKIERRKVRKIVENQFLNMQTEKEIEWEGRESGEEKRREGDRGERAKGEKEGDGGVRE